MIEFSYNYSYHTSIGMAPFEALYGLSCRSPVCWDNSSDKVAMGPPLIQEMLEQVQLIRKRMRAAQVGDKVFLRVSPTRGVMRLGRMGKLSPNSLDLTRSLNT